MMLHKTRYISGNFTAILAMRRLKSVKFLRCPQKHGLINFKEKHTLESPMALNVCTFRKSKNPKIEFSDLTQIFYRFTQKLTLRLIDRFVVTGHKWLQFSLKLMIMEVLRAYFVHLLTLYYGELTIWKSPFSNYLLALYPNVLDHFKSWR